MMRIPAANDPTRSIWLQYGRLDADLHDLKAELVLRLDKAIKNLSLTDEAAARRIGTTPAVLATILKGKFFDIPLERLLLSLTALGHEIDVTIGDASLKQPGAMTVRDVRRRAA